MTLTVEYHFQDGRRKTRNLFVPSSPSLVQQEIAKLEKEKLEREKLEELEKKNKSILIASIISGVLALILFLITIVCVCRKRVKPPKEEEYRTDENDIYGTYSRGWDGEGDYGDGDVVEVVDNNELYGR